MAIAYTATGKMARGYGFTGTVTGDKMAGTQEFQNPAGGPNAGSMSREWSAVRK